MSIKIREQILRLFHLLKMTLVANRIGIGVTDDKKYLVFFSTSEYEKTGNIPKDALVINLKNLVGTGDEENDGTI